MEAATNVNAADDTSSLMPLLLIIQSAEVAVTNADDTSSNPKLPKADADDNSSSSGSKSPREYIDDVSFTSDSKLPRAIADDASSDVKIARGELNHTITPFGNDWASSAHDRALRVDNDT